jgi:predicted small lipoprotein YifL
MRRAVVILAVLASVALAACGEEREPLTFPSAAEGRLLTPTTSETPDAATPATFDVDGCPAPEERMCQEAAALADALTQVDMDAVFTLSRPTIVECADVDPEVFPQCDGTHAPDELGGYVVAGAEPDTFVAPEKGYHHQLDFMDEGLDPEYSDEYGSADYQIVGLATCEPGKRYALAYLVGLGDPDSTLPGDRFFGTLELTEQDREWAVSLLTLDILSDWQLYYDDPVSDAGCGTFEPWGS